MREDEVDRLAGLVVFVVVTIGFCTLLWLVAVEPLLLKAGQLLWG